MPPPLSHVSLDTARSDGHKNSEMRQRGGGLGCRRSSEERCSPGRESAASDQDHAAPGHKSCGRLAATAPTRYDGETLDRGFYMSKKGVGEAAF